MKLNVFRFRKFDQTLGRGQDKVALIFILNVIEVMSGVEGRGSWDRGTEGRSIIYHKV